MSAPLTLDEIRAIPRPQTPGDYVAAYTANLVEARTNLARAEARFRIAKDAQRITARADDKPGFIFADNDAKQIFGDMVRWKSDLDHWHARKTQAEQEMRAQAVQAPDSRLPPEREPGSDDD
jgi:hypothetical protein